MKRPTPGRYVKAAAGEGVQSVHPRAPAPETAHPVGHEAGARFDAALLALGRLDAVAG